MANEFQPDLITLIDDENVEHAFEILDTYEDERGLFYALYPVFDADNPLPEEYYIMEVFEEDGEEQLAEVEDDDLIDELAKIFEDRFEKLFADEE